MSEVIDLAFEAESGRWCQTERPNYNLGNLEFGFESDLSLRSAAGAAFTADHADRFRAFLRELLADPATQELMAEDEELRLLGEAITGSIRLCAAYFGAGPGERPNLTRREFWTHDGRRVAFLDDVIRVHPTDADLMLEP
jgi:hypothetical protein